MRSLLLILLLNITTIIFAQSVKEVIDTEISFAAYSKKFNTRDAFLNFSDSTAVVFNQGKIFNVKKTFNNIKPSTSKLLWQPYFAGISASGDLGFTTGPFETKATLKDSVISSGAYSTIWKKNKNDEWKFLVDLGIELGQNTLPKLKVISLPYRKKPFNNDSFDVLKQDQKFIIAYKANPKLAFIEFLHDQACLNLKGSVLQQGKDKWINVISSIPHDLEMAPIENGISKARDLAYVYGSVKHQGKEENYLRVWQKTTKGWKIVLQTLSW